MELVRLRPTWAEVDLDAILHNVKALRQAAPGAELMAVVKADGYGHGAVPVAQTALEAGATWLGVATLEEGVDLRKAGLTAPILIMGFIPASQADTVVLYDLRPTVFHLDLAQALAQWGRALMRSVPVHMKIDTGMGRVGVQPEGALAFARELSALPQIELEGVFTHMAVADDPANPYTAEQLSRFQDALTHLRDAGITPRIRHAANSAGILAHPATHFDLVRAGIALYGQPPDPAVTWSVELKAALTWKTRISFVKAVSPGTSVSYGRTYHAAAPERIASLPVGYADGYSRHLTNRGHVLIGGQRCPIVGRVCMDQTMVRLPEAVEAKVGDEAVLIGRQGEQEITASEMAGIIGTINYEITCSVSKRVPRVYRRDGQLQKQTS